MAKKKRERKRKKRDAICNAITISDLWLLTGFKRLSAFEEPETDSNGDSWRPRNRADSAGFVVTIRAVLRKSRGRRRPTGNLLARNSREKKKRREGGGRRRVIPSVESHKAR